MANPRITRSISNLGLRREQALFSGIEGTRSFLRNAGADHLAFTPVRSRLLSEIMREIKYGRFDNSIGGTALIGIIDQSFAPSFSEIRDRFKERKQQGESLKSRLKKFGREAIERTMMPPAEKSLVLMNKIAQASNSPILGNLYVEYFKPSDLAAFDTSVQLTPDTLQNSGVDFRDLPYELNNRGIHSISFSNYNTERKSQDGLVQLPDWREWLADYSQQGLIRQITVSLNRSDLTQESGVEAMQTTRTLGEELIKEEPNNELLGDLPEQLRTIVANLPEGHALDINLRGPIGMYSPEQIRAIFANLDKLARI